jgi:hypothetical protein
MDARTNRAGTSAAQRTLVFAGPANSSPLAASCTRCAALKPSGNVRGQVITDASNANDENVVDPC